jgi:hypothetical protein
VYLCCGSGYIESGISSYPNPYPGVLRPKIKEKDTFSLFESKIAI